MNGWMARLKDRQTAGHAEGQVDGRTDRQMEIQLDRETAKLADRRTDRRTKRRQRPDGLTERWTGGHTPRLTNHQNRWCRLIP